ncbi:MAG: hypothetical protein M3Y83_14605 [Actinomycetota bacterium]|nr:hypothetical protein [Actinomycetota bacterium]
MDDVFIGSEALANRVLTRGQLRWNYRALYPDVYIPAGTAPSLLQRAVGAWLWSGRRAVVAGLAAAALHGARWIDESIDVELIWRNARPPAGIIVRNSRMQPDEIVQISGLPMTTAERTAFDLARHCPRNAAVPRLDALASTTGITALDVQPLVDRYRETRHWWRAVDALDLMDGGSQSPGESMVRLALIDAGFPAPRTRFTVTDGHATATIAMGFEAPMVAVEFGAVIPDFVVRTGWRMIRAADSGNPGIIVCLVRMAVIERGYPLWTLRRLAHARLT